MIRASPIAAAATKTLQTSSGKWPFDADLRVNQLKTIVYIVRPYERKLADFFQKKRNSVGSTIAEAHPDPCDNKSVTRRITGLCYGRVKIFLLTFILQRIRCD